MALVDAISRKDYRPMTSSTSQKMDASEGAAEVKKKLFVLGLGAQKCGTTWLYSYLKKFDEANFGDLKEYHIWDGKTLEVYKDFLVDKATLNANKDVKAHAGLKIRHDMQHVDGFYEDYFDKLVQQESVRITGDISPSYSSLSVETLQEIKRRLESKGFCIKVFFLMRDPVERSWSAVRMSRRNQVWAGGLEENLLSELDHVRKAYSNEHFQLRTNYQDAIENIEQVFAAEYTYFAIYEEMFTEESLARLGAFLGIGTKTGHLTQKVNATEKGDSLPRELRSEIAAFYGDQYAYCNARFPQTKSLWNIEA